MRRVAAAAMLGLLATCGGGGGTSPVTPNASPTPLAGWPAGTVVELVSGESGASVQGQLTVAGTTVPAGAPLPNGEPAGAAIEVSLPGFLPRRTAVRPDETRLVLWPDTPAFPGDYTKALVYTDPTDGSVAPLRRLPSWVRTVAVSPAADLQADDLGRDALRQAVDSINAALAGSRITYALGAAGDFSVPVRADPAAPSCTGGARRATTWIWLGAAGEIERAEIVVCAVDYARNVGTLTHELGHTFGLRHSLDERDLMCGWYRPGRSPAPTAREALAMALLLQRRPGTTWPDDDRNAQAAGRRFEILE
jgi:hypothetical protein